MFFSDVETVRRFSPEFWNMFPSAQNFSSNFSELFSQFENDPSAWPDDILYKPFNPFWARPNDGKFYLSFLPISGWDLYEIFQVTETWSMVQMLVHKRLEIMQNAFKKHTINFTGMNLPV